MLSLLLLLLLLFELLLLFDFLRFDPSVGCFELLSSDEFDSDLDDVELFERLFGDGDNNSILNFERVRFAMQLLPDSNSSLLLFKFNVELLVTVAAAAALCLRFNLLGAVVVDGNLDDDAVFVVSLDRLLPLDSADVAAVAFTLARR